MQLSHFLIFLEALNYSLDKKSEEKIRRPSLNVKGGKIPLKLDKLVYFNEKILPNDLKTFNSNDLAKYLRNKIQYNGTNEFYSNTTKNMNQFTNEEKIIDMRRNKFEEFNKLVLNKKTNFQQNNHFVTETTNEELIINKKFETQEISHLNQRPYIA